MILSIDRDRLLSLVAFARGAADKKSTMPMLTNLHLSAKGEELVAVGTDLALRIVATGEAAVQKAGAVCLSAETLHSIVSGLPAGEIALAVDEVFAAVLSTGTSRAKLRGVSPEDYPGRKAVPNASSAEVPASQLRALLAAVLHAVSDDTARHHLNGVHLSAKDGALIAASTDGHRLAANQQEVSGIEALGLGAGGERTLILPLRAAKELVRRLDGVTGGVVLSVGWREESRTTPLELAARLPGYVLASNLIDGQYPDWRQVMPARPRREVEASRTSLLEAGRRVLAVASQERAKTKDGTTYCPYGSRLDIEEGQLRLSSTVENVGEAEEKIAVTYKGSALSKGINLTYLLDAVKAADSEEVTLDLGYDDIDPIAVYPASSDYPRCVTMPMRL